MFIILFVGPAVFIIIAVDLVVIALIAWLKPEWLDKW